MKNHMMIFAVLAIASCHCSPDGDPTIVSVKNATDNPTTVYVSFGSDSKVNGGDWSFCSGSNDKCSFALGAHGTKAMPTSSKYLNATFAFGQEVGCGATKAEVNVNNPSWYDILDVSLVDGFSNKIQIEAMPDGQKPITLGPPASQTGNEKVYGLYPYGCDICVERQNPPCGITKGKFGCKKGTQYDPDVPCQWQGSQKGGGKLGVQVQLVD